MDLLEYIEFLEVKDFIQNKLIENGKIVQKRMRKNWFIQYGFYKYYEKIINFTKFLDKKKVYMSERIYCITHDFCKLQKCEFCKCLLKFKDFHYGYNRVCNIQECRIKYFGKVEPNGLTKAKNMGLKSLNTMKNNVDKNGLNSIQRLVIKMHDTKSKVGEDGLTIYQRCARKAAKKFKNDIVDGKNWFQRLGKQTVVKLKNLVDEYGVSEFDKRLIKIVEVKRNKIIDGKDSFYRGAKKAADKMNEKSQNGLSIRDIASAKTYETKINTIDENGLNIFQQSALKTAEIMKSTIINGRRLYDLNFEKATKTKLTKIDEQGLNGFERTTKNSFKLNYYNEHIHYQGSYEKYFLDIINDLGVIGNLKNGPPIEYQSIDKVRYYLPDFLLNDIIFEVKVDWTYDHAGQDINRRITNNLKWKSVLINGYRFILICGKKYFIELNLDDFIDIEKNLFKVSARHQSLDFLFNVLEDSYVSSLSG